MLWRFGVYLQLEEPLKKPFKEAHGTFKLRSNAIPMGSFFLVWAPHALRVRLSDGLGL